MIVPKSLTTTCTEKCKQFLLDNKYASIVILQTSNGLVKKTQFKLRLIDKRSYKTKVEVIEGSGFITAMMSTDYISFKKSDSILFESIDSFLSTELRLNNKHEQTEVFVCSLFDSEKIYVISIPSLTDAD